MFPRKIVEEPILLDSLREQIGAGLATNPSRLESERLALALAAGAAESRICFSYPRLDLQAQPRPRVPSFYALEALRASEGRLPDFTELARRAETATTARLGWPAPPDPAECDRQRRVRSRHSRPACHSRPARCRCGAATSSPPIPISPALCERGISAGAVAWSASDGLVKPVRNGARRHGQAHDGASQLLTDSASDLRPLPVRFFLYADSPACPAPRARADRRARSAAARLAGPRHPVRTVCPAPTRGPSAGRSGQPGSRRRKSSMPSSPKSPRGIMTISLPPSNASGSTASPPSAPICANGCDGPASMTPALCRGISSSSFGLAARSSDGPPIRDRSPPLSLSIAAFSCAARSISWRPPFRPDAGDRSQDRQVRRQPRPDHRRRHLAAAAALCARDGKAVRRRGAKYPADASISAPRGAALRRWKCSR